MKLQKGLWNSEYKLVQIYYLFVFKYNKIKSSNKITIQFTKKWSLYVIANSITCLYIRFKIASW